MQSKLRTQELIEETYLKNASPREICEWLRVNSNNDYCEHADNFFNLREIYEPIWAKSGRADLVLSVCRYGQSSKTLYGLFTQNQSYSHKKALLENFHFSKSIGLHDEQSEDSYFLSKKEVVELYNLYLKYADFTLFFHIFRNPAIRPNFVRELFTKTVPYNAVSDRNLLRVFYTLVRAENNYFEENYWNKDALRYAADAIINFLPNIFSQFESENKQIRLSDAEVIWEFLDSTKYLDTNGFYDIKILSLFDETETSSDADDGSGKNSGEAKSFHLVQEKSDLASLLRIIKFELGSRGINSLGISSTLQRETLQKFSLSDTQSIRELYYKNANIVEIYGSDQFAELIENTSSEFEDVIGFQLPLKSNKLKKRDGETLYRIADLIEKDNVRFVAAIAQNRSHYFNKERRDLLRRVCSAVDSRFNLFPYPLGTGTCTEVYERMTLEIKKEHPEYFHDESLEMLALSIQKNLQNCLSDISTQTLTLEKIEHNINELAVTVRELCGEIGALKAAIPKIDLQTKDKFKNDSRSSNVQKRGFFG